MSTTYTVTAADIINQAVLQQGWLDYTQTIDSTKQAQMFTVLQMMVKRWGSKGLKLWTIQDLSFPFVSGKWNYSIGPTGDVVADRPLLVTYALIRFNNTNSNVDNDIPLNLIARQDYDMLGNKFQPGTPNCLYYNPQLINGIANFYLVPDDFTVANYTPHLTVRNQLVDITSVGTNMSLPQEWYDVLVWGLAYETRLMNKVPPAMYAEIKETYALFQKDAEDWDREYAPVELGLDLSPGVYGNE